MTWSLSLSYHPPNADWFSAPWSRLCSVPATPQVGVLLQVVWGSRHQQASETGSAPERDLPLQWPGGGMYCRTELCLALVISLVHSHPGETLQSWSFGHTACSHCCFWCTEGTLVCLWPSPECPCVFFPQLGDKDLPEEEELCDIQLQTVLLPSWDAGAAVWEPV